MTWKLRGLDSAAQQRFDDFNRQEDKGHCDEYAQEAGGQSWWIPCVFERSDPQQDGERGKGPERIAPHRNCKSTCRGADQRGQEKRAECNKRQIAPVERRNLG